VRMGALADERAMPKVRCTAAYNCMVNMSATTAKCVARRVVQSNKAAPDA